MLHTKKASGAKDPEGAKEKVIEEIVRNADLKKFDPELEKAKHPPKPEKGQ